MAAPTADIRPWLVIYPVYLDSSKTVAQGRKINKEVAVSKPTLAEITTCLKKLGLLSIEQPDKAYSRDPVMEVGRVKVQIKIGENFVNPDITCRSVLYKKVAELIPTLTSRNVSAKKAGGGKGKKK